MSLKDRILTDRHQVFMRQDHFADVHTWNGVCFVCVQDDDSVLKRKNNNVNDISWDNNTRDAMIFVPKEDWPGRNPPSPNERGYFDNTLMKILQVQNDGDMYCIVLSTPSPMQIADQADY